MSTQPTPAIVLPPQSEALVDPTTGVISSAWYRILQAWLGDTVGNNNNGILGPYSVASTGIAWNTAGAPDPDPFAWGNVDAVYTAIPFLAPAGYRVQLTRIYGDLYVMPVVKVPPTGVLTAGQACAFLWAVQNTSNSNTPSIWEAPPYPVPNLLADGTYAYYQGAITDLAPSLFIPFDFTITNGYLNEDNIMISKLAIFLCTTGGYVHLETSYIIEFQLVPESLLT